jgi:hypothetical protein
MIVPVTARADPGVGDPVYGATLQRGTLELESRYGRLTGGARDATDGLVLEGEYAFSNRFAAAVLVETGRDPGGARRVEATAIEMIHTLGRIKPLAIDVALYGEYKHGLRGNDDVLEAKLLIEHRAGPFDARLNLIGERPLRSGEPVELAYAASADWALIGDDLRAGLQAFGDLGTTRRFGGRQDSYVGPVIKAEIEHIGPGEIEIEAGWLRAFGSARDHTGGQARLLISYELKL